MPANYKEAMNSPESSHWQIAMEAEISAFNEANAYSLVTVPKNQHVIGSRWVFALRPGINNIPKYNARFWARGFFTK